MVVTKIESSHRSRLQQPVIHWLIGCGLWACLLLPALARGPIPALNTATPYLIYYGNWDAAKVTYARNNYRLVILHPQSNITAAQVATIRRGPDNLLGTADDVLVFAYLSAGEDDRPGAPFVGDGQGPRVDPRASETVPLSSITNALGLPSPGGTNFASYYLDTKANPDGIPDRNSIYGGYYVNAGAPAWWNVIKNMTRATNGRAGLDEILTPTVGTGLDCDGVFLDTLEVAAPNSFGGTTFEWTAPGMYSLVERISTNYPAKLLAGNRGLFFYNPNLKTFAYNLRPHLNLVMFESYYTDSSNSGQPAASFLDNRYDYAPKLNAEAGRPDGFTMVSLGYDSTPPLSPATITQDYIESMGVQGWPLYRTDPSLNSAFNTNALLWLSTNADTQPPQWDSTAATSSTPPPARVGVRQAIPEDSSMTLRWDVARDQTGPVRYNIYYTTLPTLDFATATRLAHVAPAMPQNYALGSGPDSYPYEFTVGGLSNGVRYLFAVRAEDSATPSHEDTNTVTLAGMPGGAAPGGTFRYLGINGDTADWNGVPVLASAPPTGAPVDFASVQAANDNLYLYLRFTLHTAATPFSDYNTHIFVDTDDNPLTGYHPPGLALGSELLIESGAGYDERNGAFNAGGVNALGWLLSPPGAGTNFELRISRQAQYPGGALVFTNASLRFLLQDNRGSALVVGGVPYTFAVPGPYDLWRAQYFTATELTNSAISGDAADPDRDGIANLVEYAFALNPRQVSHPGLPRALVESTNGMNFLQIQFTRRDPPADVNYVPQVSVDLAAWDSNPANFTIANTLPGTNNTSLVTLRLLPPLDSVPVRFVRIAIQR